MAQSVFLPLTALFISLASLYLATPVAGKWNHDRVGKYLDNMTDRQVLERLLVPDKYDSNMRPEAKTQVNVSMLILSLASPDESSVTYEVGFVLFMTWVDRRLQFKVPDVQKDFAYLNALSHADKIWRPDAYFIKHGEFKKSTDQYDPQLFGLKIYSNGTVLYTTRRNMIINCEGNLRIFPFDSPKCFFGIESVSLEKDQLELQWSTEALRPFHAIKTINAYLLRNQTNRCNKRHTWRKDYSCLSVLLIFSRDLSFYFTTVFVPGMVLVTSSFISFWLDVNAVPARVMISMTTMLSYCTTTNSFRSKLPVVSDLYALNLFDYVSLFFIYASMIEFIVVNYIYRHGPSSSRGAAVVSRQSLSSQGAEGGYTFSRKSCRRSTKHDLTLDFQGVQSRPERVLQPLKATLSGTGESVLSAATSELRVDRKSVASGNHCHPQSAPLSSPLSGGGGGHNNGGGGSERGPEETHGGRESSLQEAEEEGEEVMSMWQMRNFFDWLRRPYLIAPEHATSNVQLARTIDHVSKTAFTLLFALFAFFYFLTYAFIKPSNLEDWIENEFEAID